MTTSSPPEIETKLQRTTDALERAARRSVVDDGVEDYCRLLIDRLGDLQKAWAAARPLHEELCSELVEVDPALAATAERMTDTHAALTSHLVGLVGDTLSVLAGRSGPFRLAETQALQARVLSRVAQCRSYDQRLSAWLQEAHLRDRGRGGC